MRDCDGKFAFLQHQSWSHPFVSYRHCHSRATLPGESPSPRYICISGDRYPSHWEIFPEARQGSTCPLSQHLRGRGRDITASLRSRFQATQRYIIRSCLKKEKKKQAGTQLHLFVDHCVIFKYIYALYNGEIWIVYSSYQMLFLYGENIKSSGYFEMHQC